MAKRRRLRGKKLLIASGAIAGASMIGCGDDAVTANLIPPPDTGAMDSAADAAEDSSSGDTGAGDTGVALDAVANLIPPPDTGLSDGSSDGSAGDGSTDGG